MAMIFSIVLRIVPHSTFSTIQLTWNIFRFRVLNFGISQVARGEREGFAFPLGLSNKTVLVRAMQLKIRD